MDPDGRDIRETEIYSISAGALIAGRISIGIAEDSNGNVGIFIRLEGGIGAGGNIGAIKGLKSLAMILGIANTMLNNLRLKNDITSDPPEDTGKGNFEGAITVVGNDASKGKQEGDKVSVEAAFIVGVKSNKAGELELIVDTVAIANAYLVDATIYINVSEIIQETK